MRLKEAWYKKLWKFFFQTERERKKEMAKCNEAQRKYYGLFANSAPFTSNIKKDQKEGE